MNKKEFSLKFYTGLKRIILPYITISLITLIVRLFVVRIQGGGGIFPTESISYYVNGLIDFYLVGYSWYVDLYIGLFLLIPFINKMFSNAKQDLFLILILMFLTLLPTLCHGPTFIVSMWTGIWPLTYYTIGAYLSRYNIKYSLKALSNTFIVGFLLISVLNIFMVKGHLWGIHELDSWAGPENIFNSVLFFAIILKLNFDNISEKIKNLITEIAKLSLGIYLLSFMYDKIIYYYFNQYITDTTAKLEYFFIVVPLVFILSALTAKITYKIIKLN